MEKQMIVADGQELECLWVGPEDGPGPVLVFLHEGLGCIDMWKDFPARLCNRAGLRGLVFSRAGYGRSQACDLPWPVSYMHHQAQVVLPQVLDAAGIEHAILVGHSDGGSIALVHAGSDVSGRVAAVVTLAAHVFNEDICVRSIEAAKVAYDEGDLRARLKKYHGNNVDIAFRGWNDVWLCDGFLDWNIEEFLPNIKVPVLAIQGKDDPYGTVRQVDGIVAGVGARAEKKMIADCGHSAHLQQGDETLAVIERFVEKAVI
ncbi:MAG TPA: alpha/beta hydrolase [Rhizobiales bacterium]|nr:alpha/beta hydrolase [Hyphomicrobiales bacterium]